MLGRGFAPHRYSIIFLLKKTSAILGCLLLLGSILLPFYRVRPSIDIMGDPTFHYYWSFRSSAVSFAYYQLFPEGMPIRIVDHWFLGYWFQLDVERYSWILILMFVAQIGALAAGIISIFTRRKIVALIPVIICPLIATLMVHARTSSSRGSYQPGYWLIYLSMTAFIVSLALSFIKPKPQ